MYSFSLDQSLVSIYLLSILFLGFYKKSEKNTKNFLFAGRTLSLPSLVATIVCTWYGGILEVGRFTYQNGIATWIIFGLFYYIAALLFAKYIVPKIIQSNISSIPKLFNACYGRLPAIIATFCVILLTNPAPYLKILSTILLFIWNLNTLHSLFLGASISLIYTFTGGFQSVIRTDKIQFIFMFMGFILLITFSYLNFGGLTNLIQNTPDYAFALPGNLNWTFIFAWGFIALITFIDPGFYQRTFAGKSKEIVQKSIKISILFWFFFDFMTISCGIYALAILPSIETSPYLDLANYVLPPFAKSLFIVSLLSIVMSTIDSLTFISGYTMGKDFIKILGYEVTERKKINYTRIGIALTSVLAIILANFFTYAVDIWYVLGSFIVPTLLIPLILALYKVNIQNINLLMVVPLIISIAWYLGIKADFDYIQLPTYLEIIDPMYPGILSSLILFICLKIKQIAFHKNY